jgi:hypothetical protein
MANCISDRVKRCIEWNLSGGAADSFAQPVIYFGDRNHRKRSLDAMIVRWCYEVVH